LLLDCQIMSAAEMIALLRAAPEEDIRLVRNAAVVLLTESDIQQAGEISDIKSA
jgi:hypothetical protein